MAEPRSWYLISYDIRDTARWRKVYRLMKGHGERVQYSMFRCRLSARQVEQLRWELEKRLDTADSLLVVGLCASCVSRIGTRNRTEDWQLDEAQWRIL